MSVLSFAIGDTVRHKKTGEVGVITDASYDMGDIEYGFNGNAWFNHDEFIFISRATTKSLDKVFSIQESENNIDEEDDMEDE